MKKKILKIVLCAITMALPVLMVGLLIKTESTTSFTVFEERVGNVAALMIGVGYGVGIYSMFYRIFWKRI